MYVLFYVPIDIFVKFLHGPDFFFGFKKPTSFNVHIRIYTLIHYSLTNEHCCVDWELVRQVKYNILVQLLEVANKLRSSTII